MSDSKGVLSFMSKTHFRDEAMLKIQRAAKRIDEFNALLHEKRPFRYVVETDTQSRHRSILAKKNHAVVDDAALIAGDAAHNLRSALDYAYSAIVTPYASTPNEKRAIQFPFCQEAARLDEAVKNRLANRVSDRFFSAIMGLKSYHEPEATAFWPGSMQLTSLINTAV
jgi:hypothetical protein